VQTSLAALAHGAVVNGSVHMAEADKEGATGKAGWWHIVRAGEVWRV
jgi:hypothetical protein